MKIYYHVAFDDLTPHSKNHEDALNTQGDIAKRDWNSNLCDPNLRYQAVEVQSIKSLNIYELFNSQCLIRIMFGTKRSGRVSPIMWYYSE